jgi:hypothetical protein
VSAGPHGQRDVGEGVGDGQRKWDAEKHSRLLERDGEEFGTAVVLRHRGGLGRCRREAVIDLDRRTREHEPKWLSGGQDDAPRVHRSLNRKVTSQPATSQSESGVKGRRDWRCVLREAKKTVYTARHAAPSRRAARRTTGRRGDSTRDRGRTG